MQLIYQFFRLIRLSNLLVIVLTMSFFYGLLSNYHFSRQYISMGLGVDFSMLKPAFIERIGWTDFNFILLIISVVMVAASGNIINDYFDLKADRVNKPNRLIIDKYIKRRWAIFLNWTFNGMGFLIAFYLSYQLQNWWILLISFLSINMLYFYSAVYKRKFLTGNLMVAFLTALIPLHVFIYAAFSNFQAGTNATLNDGVFMADNLLAIAGYCIFAFFLNLIREIVKDMADVKGDLLIQSKSFPIRFGFKKTKYFLGFLYFLVLVPLVYYVFLGFVFLGFEDDPSFIYFLYSIIGVVLFICVSLYIIIRYNKPKYYILASNAIKVAMLFGIFSALFYA